MKNTQYVVNLRYPKHAILIGKMLNFEVFFLGKLSTIRIIQQSQLQTEFDKPSIDLLIY